VGVFDLLSQEEMEMAGLLAPQGRMDLENAGHLGSQGRRGPGNPGMLMAQDRLRMENDD